MASSYCDDIWSANGFLLVIQCLSNIFTASMCFFISVKLVQASPNFPDRWAVIPFVTFATICGVTHIANLWPRCKYSVTVASIILVVKVCAYLILCLTISILQHVLPNLLSFREKEIVLKNWAEELSREMSLNLREEEMLRSFINLIQQIRNTRDAQIIINTAVDGLAQILDLEECTFWFPSQTNRSLQLSHTLNYSIPIGSSVSISLPVIGEIFGSSGPMRISHTCPLVNVTPVGNIEPEVVAFRVPLLHFSSTEPNDKDDTSLVSYAVMVLVLPPDNIRKFRKNELALVEAVAEEIAISLAHASEIEVSTMACKYLLKQNVSLESEVQDLERARLATSVTLSEILHQMPTPLLVMSTFSSILLTTKLTPQQRTSTETVLQMLSSLDTLMKNWTELARLEDGSLQLNDTTFNLSATFKQVINMMLPVAAVRNIFLSLALTPNLPSCVVGDKERLSQIILNVVGNAMKFTKQGHVSVTASLANPDSFKFNLVSSRDQFYLRVQVKDSGCGFDPQETPQTFNRFASSVDYSHGYTDDGFKNAISERLLYLMEGHIWIESEGVGKGCTTTFIVKLKFCHAKGLQIGRGVGGGGAP